MTLDQIYQLLNFISTKENSGNTYNIINYEGTLALVIQDIYNDVYKEYERTQYISDILNNYKVVRDEHNPLEVDSGGYVLLPNDYAHRGSLAYLHEPNGDNGLTQAKWDTITVLTDAEFDSRRASELLYPDYDDPIATFRKTKIELLPKDLGFIKLTYLINPEKPYYDYYTDQYGVIIYMPPNTSHTLLALPNLPYPYEESRSGLTTGIVHSQSIELAMPAFIHTKIITKLLSLIGINLREGDILNFSVLQQQQQLGQR